MGFSDACFSGLGLAHSGDNDAGRVKASQGQAALVIPHRQFLGTLCRANLQAPKLVPRYVQGEGKSSAHSLAQHTPRPVFQTTLNPDTEERRAEGVCVDDTAATPDRVHCRPSPRLPAALGDAALRRASSRTGVGRRGGVLGAWQEPRAN